MTDDPRREPTEQQPTTKQLPAADPVQVLLLKLQRGMEAGFEHVGERLDRQDTVLGRVVSEGVEVNTRLTRIEVRVEHAEKGVEDLEARIGRNSARVQQTSQEGMESQAQLAQERAAREAVEAKVDALTTKTDGLAKGHEDIIAKTDAQTKILVDTATAVSKFVATPTVKIIGGVLLGIVSTWLAKHYGIELPK